MKKLITKAVSILTAVMLAVTPALNYAPVLYAAESEVTEKLTDAVKQEVVRRIKTIEKADKDYVYCDISDLNLSESIKQELKDYINELTADDADMYWIEWCVPLASENKLTKVGLSLKDKYYQADSKSIDKETAKQDYEILQKRLADGELKTIIKERLQTEGLEKKSVYAWDLHLYGKDAKMLNDYFEELIGLDADFYWIENIQFDDNYFFNRDLDEEKDKIHLSRFELTVKQKYQNVSEYNVNLALAKKDFNELQERLKVEGWQPVLRERIYENVSKLAGSGMTVELHLRDLRIPMEAAELEEYIGEWGYTDPYVFALGKPMAYTDNDGEYIKYLILWTNFNYGSDNGRGVDYDKLFQGFYHYRYRISSLTGQIDDTMSDVEKTFAVQQWVTRELDYASARSDIFTLLDGGCAVCQGYMELTENLLRIYGIPVYRIESPDMNHTWNMVKLDGKYYHLDNTWDDAGMNLDDEGISGTTHFLRSDEKIYKLFHYNWLCTNLTQTPVCESEDAFEGYIFRSDAAKNQKTRFSYYQGYWYYFDKNCIYRSKIDGTEKKVMAEYDSSRTIVNMFVYKNHIYLAFSDSVYETDMQQFISGNTDMNLIFDANTDTKVTFINQFTIKQDTLRAGYNKNVKIIPLENHSSLKMNEASMELTQGESAKVSVSYISEDGNEVIWGTDNRDVLEISEDGTITAKAEGLATVYAGVDDCMDKMQVTVKKSETPDPDPDPDPEPTPEPDYSTLSEIDNGLTYEKYGDMEIQVVSGISEKVTVSELKKMYHNADITVLDEYSIERGSEETVGTGNYIYLYKDGTVADQAMVCIKGDVDGNGRIDVLDMEAEQKHILGIRQLNDIYEKAARVSGIGEKISVLDMEAIQKHILGISKIS